jgi:hypothetical protein
MVGAPFPVGLVVGQNAAASAKIWKLVRKTIFDHILQHKA